ncbi:hypothetical protein [Pedobacter sp. BMA]|uniref:DUF7033 domain-containing protein n=1 Tax=Pedobacter sp. BMA TaxID=1663685 RepID=UPI00064A4A17|nr:hypothetical protein [Pedobacter sp. BMA]KLT64070.1 hypothetical protein AB669_18580 [Pedobacter sp. BMA]
MHLIVFSKLLTPRIKYIFNFIFKDILKAEVEFTGNAQHFLQSQQCKISYGDMPLADELFFKSTSLLFSNRLEEVKVKSTEFGGYKAPFPVEDSALPFDVFAASFFLVTRYEEYLHQKKTEDEFRASMSLQNKWKILERPIIDEWALIVKSLLKKKYPDFKFHEKSFSSQTALHFHLTAGIPNGFLNKTKFVFSSLFQKENSYLSARFDELTGVRVKDETVLEQLKTSFAKKSVKPVFFISFPHIPSDYIHRVPISESLGKAPVGLLRPCASDKEKTNVIKNDLALLKETFPEQIISISQQMEPLKFPICYLNILNLGIVVDYSMGYQNNSGFRAGTATPFNWYDLQLEKVTSLVVHSYCIADTQLQYLNPAEAKTEIDSYIKAVKVVNGNFLSSWNLKSLSTNPKYRKLNTMFNLLLTETAD